MIAYDKQLYLVIAPILSKTQHTLSHPSCQMIFGLNLITYVTHSTTVDCEYPRNATEIGLSITSKIFALVYSLSRF